MNDLLPRPDSNEARILSFLATHEWRSARDVAEKLALSVTSARSALFSLKRKSLVLSKRGQAARIDGRSGRRPSVWAVPAGVAIHLEAGEG